MTGAELVKAVERVCRETGTPKEKFYKTAGITSGNMSQWRNGTFGDPRITSVNRCKEAAEKLGAGELWQELTMDSYMLQPTEPERDWAAESEQILHDIRETMDDMTEHVNRLRRLLRERGESDAGTTG